MINGFTYALKKGYARNVRGGGGGGGGAARGVGVWGCGGGGGVLGLAAFLPSAIFFLAKRRGPSPRSATE